MARPPRYPDTGDETGLGSDRESAGATPRWVVIAGILILVGFVALMVVLHLSGRVGPGAH